MGKKKRQFVTGGIYHIIQRGHNRTYVFHEQTDKATFLDFIRAAQSAFPFRVLYYVLMDNHYHLIVEMQESPLEKAMHRINLAYSKYYNQKYHCCGTIYGERYKSYSVLDMAYLLRLILYIANNPVKAGIVRHPSEYRWCAHMEIVSPRSAIVATRRLFEILGGTVEKGRRIYNGLIRQNIVPVSQAPTQAAFQAECRIDQLETQLREMLVGRFTFDQIRSGSRDQRTIEFRRDFIRLASERGYKTTEIAKILNVTERSVRNYRTARPSAPDTKTELVDAEFESG